MNVVIVDDEPKEVIPETIAGLAGYHVEEFLSPDQALAYVKANEWAVDLMLVDEVFKNNDEFSVLRSGMDLGAEIYAKYPFIPMLMFTANAHNTDKSVEAMADCGFIHFLHKSNFTDRTIEGILNNIKTRRGFQERLAKRKELKIRELDGFFRRLNGGQRQQIEVMMASGKSLREASITIDGLKISFKKLFEGISVLDLLTDADINGLLNAELHKTNPHILFRGEWENPQSMVRQLLYRYEVSDDRKSVQYHIEYEAVNFLMSVLNLGLQGGYDGSTNKRINNNYLQTITTECKPTDHLNNKFFLKKMTGRRVAIAFSEFFKEEPGSVSMSNLLWLMKTGETSVFEWIELDKRNKYKLYKTIPAVLKPKNMFNSALGLSFTSKQPFGFDPNAEAKGDAAEYEILTDSNHILYEEADFLERIGQYLSKMRLFLDELEIPDEIVQKYRLDPREFEDFEDVMRIILKVKAQSQDYQTLLTSLKQQVDALEKGVDLAVYYLLNLDEELVTQGNL